MLNISSNELLDVTPQQFSPLCSLSSIDVNNTKIRPCPCQALSQYFRRRSITMINGINCDTSSTGMYDKFFSKHRGRQVDKWYNCIVLEHFDCPNVSNATADTEYYGYCISLQKEKKLQEKSKWTWMSVLGGLGAFFVVFMGKSFLMS